MTPASLERASRLRWALGLSVVVLAGALWLTRERRTADEGGAQRQPDDREHVPAVAAPGNEPTRARAEGERAVIVGRAVDQDGEPFSALNIVARAPGASERATATDGDGSFELADLPCVELELDWTAAFDPAQPLGARVLACAVPPQAIDARRGPARLDLGTRVLPRSRPFWIDGLVVLDEDWARSKAVTLADVRIEVQAPEPDDLAALAIPPHAPPGAAPDWNDPPWRTKLPDVPATLDANGAFHFGLETPRDPFVLHVRIRRFEPHARLIQPLPNGAFAETFRFPQ